MYVESKEQQIAILPMSLNLMALFSYLLFTVESPILTEMLTN